MRSLGQLSDNPIKDSQIQKNDYFLYNCVRISEIPDAGFRMKLDAAQRPILFILPALPKACAKAGYPV
jgi:hypothetical protein